MFLRIILISLIVSSSCTTQPTSSKRNDKPFADSFKKDLKVSEKCDNTKKLYEDKDLDGWGNSGVTMSSCNPSPGYVEKKGDCDDNDYRAHPDQKNFFSIPRKNGSFDFNCDGKEKVRLINRAFCREKKDFSGCHLASGWNISGSKKVPKCGVPAEWAWNECRGFLLEKETNSASPLTINDTAKPQKKIFKCWKGKLNWKKRQLCR
jgi:hypothetical protein